MKAEFNAVQRLLDGEFSEYSLEWEVELTELSEGYYYFDITITNAEQKNTNSDLRLRIKKGSEDIKIDSTSEGTWEEVAHDHTIKNLWIALLWI